MIDQTLKWFGLYRSIDYVYEEGMARRHKRTTFLPLDYIPRCMITLDQIREHAPHVDLTVHAMTSGGIYVFAADLYIDQVMEQFSAPELAFALAHEVGHVDLGHTLEMAAFMRQRMPKLTTAGGLHSLLHRTSEERGIMSHRHEYEADAYATEIMIKLGYSLVEITEALLGFGESSATLTHPSSDDRVVGIIKHYITQTAVDPSITLRDNHIKLTTIGQNNVRNRSPKSRNVAENVFHRSNDCNADSDEQVGILQAGRLAAQPSNDRFVHADRRNGDDV